MLLRRFYDDALAQASFLIGCQRTGEALVVDPNRDADQYLAAAAAEGVRITAVTETHIHADFASGSRELAHRAGARLYLSAEGGPEWQYAFASADGAVLLRDGDEIRVGNVRVRAMHTPGHTPEHLSFLVTDGAVSSRPMGMLTGDFVFVGDVGRPDLLERAAHHEGTMESAARQLFASLRRLDALPDYLQLWPGHGAGSACGKALGAVPQTTLGYERLVNWALAVEDEDEFVRLVLEGQPDPPRYFAEMKRLNREGPPILGGFRAPDHLAPERVFEALDSGEAVVVDVRPAAAFAAGHLPGALSIPLNRSFTTWAGWLLPYDRDLHLITDGSDAMLAGAVRALAMIGLDRVAGVAGPGLFAAWSASGRALAATPQLTPAELEERHRAGAVAVVDVRAGSEWRAGHLPGVPNIPLGELAGRAGELPADRPIVLQCEGGSRSHIGTSVLEALGRRDVANLAGGYGAWRSAGLPIEREDAVAAR